jgi:hypothetical protein
MPAGNPNGYGQIFSNAMSKPMFPGAPGYGGAFTVGDRVRAQQFAQGQTGRNAAQARRMAEPAGTGYGSLVTKGQANAQAQIRGGSHSAPARRSVTARPKVGGQYDRGRTSPRPRPAGAVDDAVRNAPTPTAPAREAAERVGKKGFMRSGKGMLIGAGAAVVAGLAYSGRRGEGSSGGRTSQYRY